MKKLFAVPLIAALLSVTLVGDSRAANSNPAAQQPTIALYWESGVVAAGAVITSPVFKGELFTECVAVADNSLGGSTRALNADYLALDGTTILFRAGNTVAIAGRGLTTISATAATASLPTGVVAIPAATGKRMQFTLAAAGAAAGSLSVTCR